MVASRFLWLQNSPAAAEMSSPFDCRASWARCSLVCSANVAHFLTVSTNLYASERVAVKA